MMNYYNSYLLQEMLQKVNKMSQLLLFLCILPLLIRNYYDIQLAPTYILLLLEICILGI